MRTSLALMARYPHRFTLARPFALMLLLYTGTYSVANIADTTNSLSQDIAPSTTSSTWSKFYTVTGVNMGLSLWKDAHFARIYGPMSTRPFPTASYLPFIVRDGITICASFNLPPVLAAKLPDSVDPVVSRLAIAQMTAPALSQIVVTPLHLLGLDIYNRGGQSAWRERLSRIKSAWPATSLARMCRIIPAYGCGGVVNMSARTYWIEKLE